MDKQILSAVMSVYSGDSASDVVEAIESIVNQSRVPDEFIIVLDGPVVEEIDQAVQEYSRLAYVKIFRLKYNLGRGGARNFAISKARGDLIAIMDADDISRVNRFERQLEFFKCKNIDILGAGIEEFLTTPGDLSFFRLMPNSDKSIKQIIPYRTPFNHVTIMFKKEIFNKLGGYRQLNFVEDWDFALRASYAGSKFYNIDDVLVDVRKRVPKRLPIEYLREEISVLKLNFELNGLNSVTILTSVFLRVIRFISPLIVVRIVYELIFRYRGKSYHRQKIKD